MESNHHSRIAESLHQAWMNGVPIEPLSSTYDGLTISDAYAIQSELAGLLENEETPAAGYKLGLTSKPMRELLGVHQPDFGPVLASLVQPSGGEIAVADLIQPRIEAEIAIVLADSLAGPGVEREDVLGAMSGALPALEVVDSRIRDWQITIVDTVADLASCARVIVGSEARVEGFDLRLTGMSIWKNDELMATGTGAMALGDPVGAVAWLANTLADYGETLLPGRFVMTGSLHAAFEIARGDIIEARFDRLGDVSVRIT